MTVSLPNFQISYKYPLSNLQKKNVFIYIYLKVKFWRYAAFEKHNWFSFGFVSSIQPVFFHRIWLWWTVEALLEKDYISFVFQLLKDNLCKRRISRLVGGKEICISFKSYCTYRFGYKQCRREWWICSSLAEWLGWWHSDLCSEFERISIWTTATS